MDLDLDQLRSASTPGPVVVRAEVCVVGAGIAGLVCAHRLTQAGKDVLLLEGGGASASPDAGSPEGSARGLGGTSSVWGAQLLPVLDTTCWPVTAAELDAYTPAIERLLGTDTLPFDADTFFSALGVRPVRLGGAPLQARLSKFAPFSRRNLGATLGRELLAHPTARVALHAAATELLLTHEGTRVASVRVRTRAGGEVSVQARHVVLAAGTAETCALLLGSRSVHRDGVGNANGCVGQHLHDHLTVEAARFEGGARDRALDQLRPWLTGGLRGTLHSFKLETAPSALSDLPHAMAHVTFEEPEGSGLRALREFLRGRQAGAGAGPPPGGTLLAGLRDLARLYTAAHTEQRRYISGQAHMSLRLNCAQTSPSGIHLRLTGERDAAGRAITALQRGASAADLNGLRRFARAVRAHFAQRNFPGAPGLHWDAAVLAELPEDAPLAGLDNARHLMGGAPMGEDPATSVVDGHLQVHGVTNLSVASAAVLPDGRAQLPTMTLMALSLRLADHLSGRLGRGV